MLCRLRTHASAGLLAGLALAACGGPDGDPSAPAFGEDDLGDIRGVEEIASALTPIENLPVLTKADGKLVVTLKDGETAVLSMRSIDKAILVNGHGPVADATDPTVKATSTNVKNIEVKVEASATATVVLDFANGTFTKGAAGGPGIAVDFTGGNGSFRLRGKKTADQIVLGEKDGVPAIAFDTDAFADITVKGATPPFIFSLGDGNDVFTASNTGTGAKEYGTGVLASTIPVIVYGGAGDDKLTGGAATGATAGNFDDILYGNEGADTLVGGPGKDQLFGGPGNDLFDEGTEPNGADEFHGGEPGAAGDSGDTVTYANRTWAAESPAPVTVTVGAGADDGATGEGDDIKDSIKVVIGTSGDDTMTAADNGTTLTGGAGNDKLTGGAGSDILNGDAGNDVLDGKGGDDKLYGGAGEDRFLAANADGSDLYDGGADIDTFDCSACTAGVRLVLDGKASSGDLDGTGLLAGHIDTIGLTIENVIGGSGDDEIIGSAADNVIDGGPGADTMRGGDGVDTIDYSARTTALDGPVSMDGSATQAATDGAGEGDNIWNDVENLNCPDGAELDEDAVCIVTGNDRDNVITGGPGKDVLKGGKGDDVIDGKGDDDEIDCGEGSGDIVFHDPLDVTTPPVNCEL